MSRKDFIKELENLLQDISLEEREDALKFYENYFEDAGEEKEEYIIQELGSPELVAKIIKTDLGIYDRSTQGEYTERGYEDQTLRENRYVVTKTKLEKEPKNQESDTKKENANSYEKKNTNRDSSEQGSYTQQKSHINIILLILICIFAIPVGIPVACSIFALFLSLFIVIGSLLLVFGITGVALLFVAFLFIIIGITQLFTLPYVGFVCIGGGLIVLGISILFIIAAIFFFKLIPLCLKGCVAICKMPFRNRRVMA